ncbi:hypothetical protein ANO11243_087690 [Dothideomycetidae sp. 11243]|nr:hypothetical protein ANO11243_087690 [fungal sp. No.11243]
MASKERVSPISRVLYVVIGEVANFAAYAFAPAILVTPLGALSVLIGAVLGAYFLGEKLGTLGKLGCATCLIGSVVIVLHAPPDKDVQTIDEILDYAIQPGFLFYCFIVTVFAFFMIYVVAPKYGRKNPLVYLSICSTVGSISICAVKGLGIALKLTLGGSNQLSHPSTYVFLIVTVVAIMTQMNYFNKALSQFNTNIVNPLYYVTFTTCTLTASFILFKGFNTYNAVNTISLLCGFLVIFSGVYLLNLSREDPNGTRHMMASGSSKYDMDGIPTDGMAAPLTRLSMQARRSGDSHRRSGSLNFSPDTARRSQERLMHNYDMERQSMDRYGLSDLAEDEEDDDDEGSGGSGHKRTSFDRGDAKPNGRLSGSGARRKKDSKLVDLEAAIGNGTDDGKK